MSPEFQLLNFIQLHTGRYPKNIFLKMFVDLLPLQIFHVKKELSSEDDIDMVIEHPTLKFEPVDYECLDEHARSRDQEFQEQTDRSEVEEKGCGVDKIEFVELLGLVKKTKETEIKTEILSAVEKSFLNKCKVMIGMHDSLKCACHSISFNNLQTMFSHLRTAKVWFPAFTCFNCMSTCTDSSSSRNHRSLCGKQRLEGLHQLSQMEKRSHLKVRIYQSYRCTKCSCVFSFLDDFRNHISKNHNDRSCMVEYYCEICKKASKTVKDFIDHARRHHDDSEENESRAVPNCKAQSKCKSGNLKRKRSTAHSSNNKVHEQQQLSILQETNCMEVKSSGIEAAKPGNGSTKRLRGGRSSADDRVSTRNERNKENLSKSARCPVCEKEFSRRSNMLRHLKIHQKSVLLQTKQKIKN